MIIIALLIALFALFFVVRKHTGPATLAMIAGLSIYDMFGGQFIEWVKKLTEAVPDAYLQAGLCVLFVAGFPILLYLRSYHGGLFGILRIAQAAILAATMTLLIVPAITQLDFLAFDNLSRQIVEQISNYQNMIVLVAVLSAYYDILVYRD